jgi:hypothetical protein
MSLHNLQLVYAYSRPVLIAVDILASRAAVVSLHKRKDIRLTLLSWLPLLSRLLTGLLSSQQLSRLIFILTIAHVMTVLYIQGYS